MLQINFFKKQAVKHVSTNSLTNSPADEVPVQTLLDRLCVDRI